MDPQAPPHDLEVAFGPVGVAGLILAAVGLLRRRPWLFALGGTAVAADALVPELRGRAALQRRAGTTPQGDARPLSSR